jgi:hypothetical protein
MRSIRCSLIISLVGLIGVACEPAESEEMIQTETERGGVTGGEGADTAGTAGAEVTGGGLAGGESAGGEGMGGESAGGEGMGGEPAGADEGLMCVEDRDCQSLDEEREPTEPPPPRCEGEVWIEARRSSACVEGQCVSQLEDETDCAAQGYRCKPEVGCVDAPECIDAFECPPPPPVAFVDCDGDISANVIYTPTCSEEGLCGFEERYDPIRDCSLDQRICLEGECVVAEE